MKKNVFYSLVLLCMTLFTFSSCDVDNSTTIYPQPLFLGYWQPYSMNTNGQYAIGGYVNGQQSRTTTRAAIDGGNYTNFALYSWTNDSVVMNGYNGTFNGNTWGYSEDLKYFDNDVAEYNFIGVIPQDANQSFNEATGEVTVEAVGFTTDDDGAQTGTQSGTYAEDRELLYAATTVQNANYSAGATLNFNHANAKVYLKFTSDDPNTQIVDFTPYTPGSPEVPATPGTPVTETRQSKVIDELVAGNIVGWPYAVDANLTSTQANNFYNGLNRGNTDWLAANWLDYLANDVNSQFEYYDENGNKINPDDTSWKWPVDNTLAQGSTSNNKKNKIFFKLKDSVNKEDFANGNDVFWNALCEHEDDWSNGSTSLKSTFEKSYNEGWRVVRIGYISNWNSSGQSVGTCVWLVNNTQMTLTVTTITGGTEYQPAVPATGHEGIIVLPATSVVGNGTDAILASYPSKVTATVGLNGIEMIETDNESTLTFTKPNGYIYTDRVASPTTWYTFPALVNSVQNVGYTVKFSYTYKGVTKYDNRVFIPATDAQWVKGKYYTYIININGKGNGFVDPTEADEDDPTIPKTNEIVVTTSINDYEEGEEHEYTIK